MFVKNPILGADPNLGDFTVTVYFLFNLFIFFFHSTYFSM